MKRCKNGEIHFKNLAELHKETNERVKIILKEKLPEYKQAATKEALTLLLPIACTALYESHGFAEKRQQKFIDYFMTHIECVNSGVTTLEEYKEFCIDQGYKYFNMEEI